MTTTKKDQKSYREETDLGSRKIVMIPVKALPIFHGPKIHFSRHFGRRPTLEAARS
jgi:hypothetical protein